MIGKAITNSTMRFQDGQLILDGIIRYDPVFLDERLFRDGLPTDMTAFPIIGNCLTPQVISDDIVLAVLGGAPQDGDIVLVEKHRQRLAFRYRSKEGEKPWLESAHGKQTLDDCTVVGVVALVARASGDNAFELVPIQVHPLEFFMPEGI